MKLKVPKGCGGVSHGGVEYDAVNGVVEVPDTATIFLDPGYGCTEIFEPEPKPEPEKGKKTGKDDPAPEGGKEG